MNECDAYGQHTVNRNMVNTKGKCHLYVAEGFSLTYFSLWRPKGRRYIIYIKTVVENFRPLQMSFPHVTRLKHAGTS